MIMNNVETTKCIARGHDLSIKGLYTNKAGYDECRQCRLEADARWKAKNPEGKTASNNTNRFGGNRELVIQRDREQCVLCGMTRVAHKEKYGRDITVDHIDGQGRYTAKDEQNNNLDNLQTLCLPCHGTKDIRRKGRLKKERQS